VGRFADLPCVTSARVLPFLLAVQAPCVERRRDVLPRRCSFSRVLAGTSLGAPRWHRPPAGSLRPVSAGRWASASDALVTQDAYKIEPGWARRAEPGGGVGDYPPNPAPFSSIPRLCCTIGGGCGFCAGSFCGWPSRKFAKLRPLWCCGSARGRAAPDCEAASPGRNDHGCFRHGSAGPDPFFDTSMRVS